MLMPEEAATSGRGIGGQRLREMKICKGKRKLIALWSKPLDLMTKCYSKRQPMHR